MFNSKEDIQHWWQQAWSHSTEEFFIQAIKIDSNYIDAHYNLGIVYFRLEEFDKSIKCYEKAIKIDPNNLDSHNNLGVTFAKLKNFKKAVSCYKKVIEIDPNNSEAYNNLGIKKFFFKKKQKKKY